MIFRGGGWGFIGEYDRQQDGEERPLAGNAGDPNGAAVVLDDPVGRGQPQSGSPSSGFSGEKRNEDPAQGVAIHPYTRIGHLDSDVIPRRATREAGIAGGQLPESSGYS